MGHTTAAKTKEPFAWDYEDHLGFVYPEEDARKCMEVKRAKKGTNDYIVLTEWRYFAPKDKDTREKLEEQWNPIKGMTIPAHMWGEINILAADNLEADPPTDPTDDEEEA